MNYWLIKSPFKNRTWQDVVMSGMFSLYGIRNNQAKKNIGEMNLKEKALFYHNKTVFGIMEVFTRPYQDPTSDENWFSIDFKPVKTFEKPISLEWIKQNEILANTAIIRQSRLSVVRLSEVEFKMFEVE